MTCEQEVTTRMLVLVYLAQNVHYTDENTETSPPIRTVVAYYERGSLLEGVRMHGNDCLMKSDTLK